MKNIDKREDCPGADHPVSPEPRESNSKLSTPDKWMIGGCIAAFVIGMTFVWLAINEKIRDDKYIAFRAGYAKALMMDELPTEIY